MTQAALILAVLSLLPTLATLSVTIVRYVRLHRRGINSVKRMVAAEKVVSEALRVVKHAVALFGITLVLLNVQWLWGMSSQDIRSWCLAVIAALLAVNSLWSLRGMHRVNEYLEKLP